MTDLDPPRGRPGKMPRETGCRRRRASPRPHLERLECRALLSAATITVPRRATAVIVSPSDIAPVAGEPLSIVAVVSVNPPGAAAPTGIVAFMSGPTVLAVEPVHFGNGLSYARVPAVPFGPAGYAITAVYSGDAGDAPSVSTTDFVVPRAPTVTYAAPKIAAASVGQGVKLVAAVDTVPPGLTVPETGTVAFLDGSTVLGAAKLGPIGATLFATFTTATLSPGVHQIAAVYTGDLYHKPSVAATFTVTIGWGPVAIERTDAAAVAQHALDLQQVAAGQDNVVFFGDSLTAFWAYGQGASVWSQDIAGFGAADFGVVSDTAENLLWRVEDGELAGHPKVAVVAIGSNNLDAGDTVDYTTATIEAVVVEIEALSPTTKIVLMGLLPRGTPTDPIRQEIAQVNAALAAGESGRPNVTFLDIGPELTGPDGSNAADFLPDLVHPNVVGYQVWADAIGGLIRAMLG